MAVKTMKQVAAMLKKARAKKGLGLREASRQSGVSVGTLSKLESGEIDNPTFVTMVMVSNTYGLKSSDWF